MTLDEWIADVKRELDKFEADYRRENKRDPENWPMEMGPGDWDEQFDLRS